jgi:hypothetical protein
MKTKLFTIAMALFMVSCAKEEPQPATTTATYTVYSESGNFTFKCPSKNGWINEHIKSHNYTRIVEVENRELGFISQVLTDSIITTDSIYFAAEINGKRIVKAHRSNIKKSRINLSLQLTEIK